MQARFLSARQSIIFTGNQHQVPPFQAIIFCPFFLTKPPGSLELCHLRAIVRDVLTIVCLKNGSSVYNTAKQAPRHRSVLFTRTRRSALFFFFNSLLRKGRKEHASFLTIPPVCALRVYVCLLRLAFLPLSSALSSDCLLHYKAHTPWAIAGRHPETKKMLCSA